MAMNTISPESRLSRYAAVAAQSPSPSATAPIPNWDSRPPRPPSRRRTRDRRPCKLKYELKIRSSAGTGNSVYRARLARHVIHQQILAEIVGSSEVGLAAAHLRNFLHKLHQPQLAGQHKSIDHYPGTLAFGYFFEGLADDERIESKSVFINSAIFQSKRRRFAVGNHHDLTHVFALPLQDALRQPQSFAGIGVIRAHLHSR